MDPVNLLILGDKPSLSADLEDALSDPDYQIVRVESYTKPLFPAGNDRIDLVILDLSPPDDPFPLSDFSSPPSRDAMHPAYWSNGESSTVMLLDKTEPLASIDALEGTFPILVYADSMERISDSADIGGTGIVDYIFPPLHPQIVRARIRNLVELHRKSEQLTEQSRLLAGVDHQMAQQRQAIVGQLTAGIAHDFNNILAVITLYCQLLQKALSPLKRTQYLDTIHQQASRGADLISQLLDFGRQSLMQPTSVDLVSFLHDVVELLSRTFPENIEVNLTSHVETLYVRVDPTHLQQVFMNLAINARDAISGDGTFHITLGAIDVGMDNDAPINGMEAGIWAKVTVSDNGCGMSNEVLARIFEPFFTTKGPDEGTGLGLAQVYGIIQQLGGEIEVASYVGKGSTFIVYLPIDGLITVPLVHEDDSQVVDLPSLFAPKSLLLVEDEPAVRKALEALFNDLGFNHVLVAENGQHALEIYKSFPNKIDLVFSDMVMPKMGGLELFDVLRDENPTLKMIVTTGYPLENGGGALLERGISDWLLKPFSIEEVTEKIALTLEE